MIIANRLRKENIVEYLLYMWQVEDLLRAYDCSLGRLREEYISRFEVADSEEIVDWYADLIRMMRSEGKRESGHLVINELIVQQLSELNAQLLASPKYPFYNAQYYKVLPYIVELRAKARGAEGDEGKNGKDLGEIETCVSALYGVMLLRLQKKELSTQTLNAVTEISTFLGMLSDYYFKDKTEDLFDD